MLKNMKIGKRLIVGFIVAIVISSIAGLVAMVLLNSTDMQYSVALENYGFAQGDLGNVGRHFQAGRVLNLEIITASDPKMRAEYLAEVTDEDVAVDKYLAQALSRANTPQEIKGHDELVAALGTYRAIRSEVFKTNETVTDTGEILAIYHDKIDATSVTIRGHIDKMVNAKTSLGSEASIYLTDTTRTFTLIVIGIIVAAFVVAMILAVIISHGISKPLALIADAAMKMSEGDFDVDFDIHSRDEVGELADGMREMIKMTKDVVMDTARGLSEVAGGNFDITPRVEYKGVFRGVEDAMVSIITGLSETISQIRTASEQVSSGSSQVSNGAQALAQGATEQASAIEELSASISEVSEQIKSNTANAVTASGLVAKVGKNIDESSVQMDDMQGAMTKISDSSAEIGKIIKTIEDIAFQTNILALNAAVEAARAGAAGKGFAVVADEVRSLATKSSEAAKQTSQLIEDSINSVGNGVHIADVTAKSLVAVVTGAKEITALIEQISLASVQQSTSIAQINLGIEQISSVVQTNSATSEESAAASEELNGQASIMNQQVSQFRLKNR